MVTVVPQLSGYGSVLHAYVSVPLVPCLLDGVRYMMPEDVPAPESRDLRRIRQGKPPRAPSLRMLVRYALKCESAERLGHKLRRRYERQARRAGLSVGQTDAELEERLDKLLADPAV
jgi:hypothetical protein